MEEDKKEDQRPKREPMRSARPARAVESKEEVAPAPVAAPKVVDVLEAKAQAILDSKMPEAQKMQYLKAIGWIKEPSDQGKVMFATYAKIRKIAKDRLSALEHYPKAKSVRLATLEEWDNIFKNF
jgi:hypothetical protein